MKDFLAFRTMLTPSLMISGFVFLSLAAIIGGVAVAAQAEELEYRIGGILIAALGPILIRVQMEAIMVFFRINEALFEMQGILEEIADSGRDTELESLEE